MFSRKLTLRCDRHCLLAPRGRGHLAASPDFLIVALRVCGGVRPSGALRSRLGMGAGRRAPKTRPPRGLSAKAEKKGRRPIAPPRLFVLWNHPCQNRSLSGRLNVWTRTWRSLPRPVPMLISENVGECARPRCYRVSVARATGPDPAISSVFTGLASLVGRFVGSDGVCVYSICSRRGAPYSGVFSPSASGRVLPADGTKSAPGRAARGAGGATGRRYSASARAFLATSATSAKVASSL